MCGIAGIIARSARWASHNPSHFLFDLKHRGPDDEGWLLYGDSGKGIHLGKGRVPDLPYRVALLFRRLSILDLSERGSQPMGAPDENLWIVFNGEIYNYLELRSTLEERGYTFRSRTDTEVLLYGYHCFGEDVLQKLVGMFAFAILDLNKQELLLARDPFGIKPLFYLATEDGLAFASELPPLLKLPGVRAKANLRPLYAYLKTGLLDYSEETFFEGILRLPPGRFLRIPLEYPSPIPSSRTYITFQIEPPDPSLTFDQAKERLREIFMENVRLHLRSDVPVGTALSGGIDSSAIVCAMRLLEPHQEIHSFSFVARGHPINEEKWVDLVTNHAHLIAHKIEIHPEELVRDLDELIITQGEPCGSTSIYAQFRVFRKVHETGIKVILDGQGSDEMFAGYLYYRSARLLSLIHSARFRTALELFRETTRHSQITAPRFLWHTLRSFFPPSLVRSLRRFTETYLRINRGVNERWFREQGIILPLFPTPAKEALRHTLLLETTTTSLPALLRYEDRNSMHFSVESRVPFLTPALARFVFSLPEEYIMGEKGLSKRILREALRGIVPDPILDRRDKIGFATPEQAWWKDLYPWIQRHLEGDTLRSLPFFQPRLVEKEWREVMQGKAPFDFRIWRWVNLIRWFELFQVELPQRF